jgi:hypothetical protein
MKESVIPPKVERWKVVTASEASEVVEDKDEKLGVESREKYPVRS